MVSIIPFLESLLKWPFPELTVKKGLFSINDIMLCKAKPDNHRNQQTTQNSNPTKAQ
jgi:hypothetical protein